VTQVAVRTAAPARAVDMRGELHPLATSVTAVDRAVTSLSFRTLKVTGSHWPNAPWIGCEHALSDPAFFLGGGGRLRDS
jgi:hypothetical protein